MFRTAVCAFALIATPALADFQTVPSEKSVAETMDALEAAVTEAGAAVFARVDHAAGARGVDMELQDAELLIFGNPRLGTPALQQDIRAGYVLPLRVLVYADEDGSTVVLYERPEELFDGLDVDTDAEFAGRIAGALQNLTAKAVE